MSSIITTDEIEERIREILDYGKITISDHVSQRMEERNYEMSDIIHILKCGKVLKFNKERNEQYRCEVHGEDIEGVKGAVIAIVIKNYRLIIVTVLGGV